MKFKSGTMFYLTAFLVIVLATHIFMLVDTAIHQVYASTVQNAVGCLIAVILLLMRKKANPFLLIFLAFFHLELQVFLAIILMGWNLQLQYYYLGIMVFSVLMSFSLDSSKLTFKQKFLGITSTALFFTSYAISRRFSPMYLIPDDIADKVASIVYISIFFGLAFLSNLFRVHAVRCAYIIKNQAFRDELTKLNNRRGIRIELDKAMDTFKTEGIPYSVAIFDIDDFKQINDTYGHDAGDLVLKKIGRVLKEFENETTTACRWGGEEFLVLRQNSIYHNCMEELAQRISTEISQLEFTASGKTFKITITGGCATSEADKTLGEIIKTADNRLYIGKQTGKNKIVSTDK